MVDMEPAGRSGFVVADRYRCLFTEHGADARLAASPALDILGSSAAPET
jgi:hypothetical protein